MASKRKGLPFVVQPRLEPIIERIGSEESGIFEIPRKGYLTVAEKSIVEQASSDMSDQGELLAAVKEISRGENISVAEVFEMLQGDAGSELLVKYSDQVAQASASAKNQQNKIEIIAATALIMCRIDTSWGAADSIELHPDLLSDLYKLYLEEDARSLEAFEARSGSEKPKK